MKIKNVALSIVLKKIVVSSSLLKFVQKSKSLFLKNLCWQKSVGQSRNFNFFLISHISSSPKNHSKKYKF